MPGKLGLLLFRSGEVLSYLAGTLMIGFFVTQLAQGEVERQSGISQFEQLAQANQQDEVAADSVPSSLDEADSSAAVQREIASLDRPDTSLWAPGRVADYEASLKAELPDVLGVLEMPSVGLKVPVYATNTDLVMDRGAGIINGMSYPHEPGNIGISGHRDGYFRVLKDVKIGDPIILETLEGPKSFTISETHIVEIKDETLLRDTQDQTVTLVTCYPFYFVGHAPKRFIVTATLDTTYVKPN